MKADFKHVKLRCFAIVDIKMVRAAASRISKYIHETPVCTCRSFDDPRNRSFFFKCENLQKTGSFKVRGALNAVLALSEAKAKRGLVTASSGNFGLALAYAGALRGVATHVVMPNDSSRSKRRAVVGYGGEVYSCEPTLEDREIVLERVSRRTGATYVSPHDDPLVIAGQGTVALELVKQVPRLDVVVAPVGGGGLVAGMALVVNAEAPRIAMMAAEPEGASDTFRSKDAGFRIPEENPKTIAEGLLVNVGELTWPFIRDLVREVILVDDNQIMSAMRLIFERMKIVVEPSGAVAAAAVLAEKFYMSSSSRRIGVVLSGGNTDLDRLPWSGRPAWSSTTDQVSSGEQRSQTRNSG